MIDNKILIATQNRLSTGDALDFFAKVRSLEHLWIHKDVNSLAESIEEVYYKQEKTIVDKCILEFVEAEDKYRGYIPTDKEAYSIIFAALVKACEMLGESGWHNPEGKEMNATDWLVDLIDKVKKGE